MFTHYNAYSPYTTASQHRFKHAMATAQDSHHRQTSQTPSVTNPFADSGDSVHFGRTASTPPTTTFQPVRPVKPRWKRPLNAVAWVSGLLAMGASAGLLFVMPLVTPPIAIAIGAVGAVLFLTGLVAGKRQKKPTPPAPKPAPAPPAPKPTIIYRDVDKEQRNYEKWLEDPSTLSQQNLSDDLLDKAAQINWGDLRKDLAQFISRLEEMGYKENIENDYPTLFKQMGPYLPKIKNRFDELYDNRHKRGIYLSRPENRFIKPVVQYFIEKQLTRNEKAIVLEEPNTSLSRREWMKKLFLMNTADTEDEEPTFQWAKANISRRKALKTGLFGSLGLYMSYLGLGSLFGNKGSEDLFDIFSPSWISPIRSTERLTTSKNEFDDYFDFLISPDAEGTGLDSSEPQNSSQFGITYRTAKTLASHTGDNWPEEVRQRAKMFDGVAEKIASGSLTKNEAKPLAKEIAWIMSKANEEQYKDMAWLRADTYYNNGEGVEAFIYKKALADSEKNNSPLFDEYEKWRIKAWSGHPNVPPKLTKKNWAKNGPVFINRENKLRELVGLGKKENGFYEWLHFVKEGENAFSIGKKYGVSIGTLATYNPTLINPKNPDQLSKYAVLKIPQWKHKVRTGETLGAIAKLYNVSPQSLSLINNISTEEEDDIESALAKPADGETSINIPFWIYQTKDNETFEKIEEQTLPVDREILATLNGFENVNDLLNAGQYLVVPGTATEQASKTLDKTFISPVEAKLGGAKGDGYGMRIHPTYKRRKMHYGIDYSLKRLKSNKILAACDGQVVEVNRRSSGFGYKLVINHFDVNGKNVKTLYGHCEEMYVKPGQWVKAGDHIADVGNRGTSTNYHLHFEVWEKDKPVNPKKYGY